MEQLPIQVQFFEPVIPLIIAMGPLNWVEIGLAEDVVLDRESILQYFHNTVEVGYQATRYLDRPNGIIRGYLKNPLLWAWLHEKWTQINPRWGYFEYEARGPKQRERLPQGEIIRKYLENSGTFESQESFEQRKEHWKNGPKESIDHDGEYDDPLDDWHD